MRKRELSDRELSQIRKLRQNGASWLKIEKETRVPRRSAKRSYNDWEHSQSLDELKVARSNVAAVLFREHIDAMLKIARHLATELELRQSPNDERTSQEFLDDLWARPILSELEYQQTSKNEAQYIQNNNLLIYQCLRRHTAADVRWKLLDDWKHGWDNSLEHSRKLRAGISDTVKKITVQDNTLPDRVKAENQEIDHIKNHMTDTALGSIWSALLLGKQDSGEELEETLGETNERLWAIGNDHYKLPHVVTVMGPKSTTLVISPAGDKTLFKFNDEKLANEIRDMWNQTVKCTLSKSKRIITQLLSEVVTEVVTMEAAIAKLNRMLNPLILQSIILRTRCEICPA